MGVPLIIFFNSIPLGKKILIEKKVKNTANDEKENDSRTPNIAFLIEFIRFDQKKRKRKRNTKRTKSKSEKCGNSLSALKRLQCSVAFHDQIST